MPRAFAAESRTRQSSSPKALIRGWTALGSAILPRASAADLRTWEFSSSKTFIRGWAAFGFRRDEANVAPRELVAQEGEADPAEVGAATVTGDHHVGLLARHGHLLARFQADHGLMQQYVVEHRTQGVVAIRRLRGFLHGFGDGDT